MRLGIVIGITTYPGTISQLPACGADANAIATLIRTESTFDDVLLINENTTAATVKRQLTDFVNRHKSSPVDEVLFYFTGHGDFVDDEFYYLLSDYDPKRRKQTSLENREVDSLLKALSPNVTAKLIDACHSGVTYIKDSNAFDTYLKSSSQCFKKCYFLFSSQVDQSSYQDSTLSFFTRAIINAVLEHDEGDMRYKDVIDYVSDAFTGHNEQTPFFVVQADFTDNFCSVSTTLKTALQKALDGKSSPLNDGRAASSEQQAAAPTSLLELIKADAQRYSTEAETTESLYYFREQLESSARSADFLSLFSLELLDGKEFSSLPDTEAIGNWLDQNQHSYFAAPYYRTVKVKKRKPKNPFMPAAAFLIDDDSYKIVEEEESRIAGFRPTIDMPFLFLLLQADPLFPNLARNDCFVVPIASRTDIRLFYAFNRYRDVGWTTREKHGDSKWVTQTIPTKDKEKFSDAARSIVSKFQDFIREPLLDKFGLNQPSTNASGKKTEPSKKPEPSRRPESSKKTD